MQTKYMQENATASSSAVMALINQFGGDEYVNISSISTAAPSTPVQMCLELERNQLLIVCFPNWLLAHINILLIQ